MFANAETASRNGTLSLSAPTRQFAFVLDVLAFRDLVLDQGPQERQHRHPRFEPATSLDIPPRQPGYPHVLTVRRSRTEGSRIPSGREESSTRRVHRDAAWFVTGEKAAKGPATVESRSASGDALRESWPTLGSNVEPEPATVEQRTGPGNPTQDRSFDAPATSARRLLR